MPQKFTFSACKADPRLSMSAIEIISVQASKHGPKVEDHDWKQRGELLTKKDSSELMEHRKKGTRRLDFKTSLRITFIVYVTT